jgi:hypothetical protein
VGVHCQAYRQMLLIQVLASPTINFSTITCFVDDHVFLLVPFVLLQAAVCVDYDRPLLQGRTQSCLDHFWVSCCLCINNTPSLINQLMHLLTFRLVSSPTSNKPTCRNPCNASQKSPDDDSFGMDMDLSWVVPSFPCTFSDRWPHESESSCLSACQPIVASKYYRGP